MFLQYIQKYILSTLIAFQSAKQIIFYTHKQFLKFKLEFLICVLTYIFALLVIQFFSEQL